MNAVDSDVSKGKSTVAIRRSMGKVVQMPKDIPHDMVSLARIRFWHCDCISRVSEKAFVERCQKWCKRQGDNSLLQRPQTSTPTVSGTSLLCRRTTIPSC